MAMMKPAAELFDGLPELTPADRGALMSLATSIELAPGELLISAGARSSALFVITGGSARVDLAARDGKRTVGRVEVGAPVGEMSLLTGDPTSADVVAAEPTTAVRIERAALDAAIARDEGLGRRLYLALARVIAARLARADRQRNGEEEPASPVQALARTWARTLADIPTIELSPLVQTFVARYEQVGDRDAFLWKWAARGIDATTLSTVPAALRPHTRDTKLLAVILNVLLDDLADLRGSESLLEAALSIPFAAPGSPPPAVPEGERPYFALIADLWSTIDARCRELPRWARHRLLLSFDYRQVFSAMRYGLLLKLSPALLNPSEHELYPPHNMNMMVFSTIDLMCGDALPDVELGPLREVAWDAQSMGQISNMIVTWEREIPQRDFSSRIFARALAAGVLTAEELGSLPPETIAARVQQAGIEKELFAEWQLRRTRIGTRAPRLPSVDVPSLIDGLDALLGMTLASRYRL
jgi:CRP-like cAMP-binding protein